jgi:methylated-DNA-protein-cysteine methyltransferase-like protein
LSISGEVVYLYLATMKSSADAPAPERNFFQDVHEVVRLIPPGRVSTYGAIAHYLGARHGARMVGLEKVPAQRVVNRNGLLTGRHHFATPTAMQEALEAEGVRVEDDQVVEFKQLFWDPSTELE